MESTIPVILRIINLDSLGEGGIARIQQYNQYYIVSLNTIVSFRHGGRCVGKTKIKYNISCTVGESNPAQLLGRQLSYHWTNSAAVSRHEILKLKYS